MGIELERYPLVVRTLHWLAVALVLGGYLTSEAMEEGGGLAASVHVMAGLGLVMLAIPRIGVHWWYRRHLASARPGLASRAAQAGQLALLIFLVVQPILGVLAVWAEGEALAVPFSSWVIASPFPGNLGEWPEELHEGLGTVFYAVIGLHAAAALWHHFIQRDLILRRMLW